MSDQADPGPEHSVCKARRFFRYIVPQKGEYLPWRGLLPQGRYHWISALLLWAFFLLLLGTWVHGNRGALFDPLLQNDDARQHLFAFHRYTPERALVDDPLALDYLALSPPGIHALYALLVPRFGLFVAPKIVQGLCYLIVLAAVLVLIKSKRGGLACAILLGFCVFHTPFICGCIAGGLPRGFAIPLLMLWCAGAVGKSERLRFIAIVLSALTYPTAMLLMLVAEGFLTLEPLADRDFLAVIQKCTRLFCLVCVCLACIAVYHLGQRDVGRLPTLEEARENPAFLSKGRSHQIPFPDMITLSNRYFFNFFGAKSSEPFSGYTKFLGNLTGYQRFHLYVAFPAVLLLLFMLGRWRSPIPYPAISVFLAAVFLYLIACALAFRLFIPKRYIQYGMLVSATLLTVTSIGLVLAKEKNVRRRATVRNVAACAFIVVFCLLTGDGVKSNTGMNISWKKNAGIYTHVKTLPPDALISGHPKDLENIPFWTGRAVLANEETALPWLSKIWNKQSNLIRRTLDALYATNRCEVIAFAEAFGVTHFLLRSNRYSHKFSSSRPLVEPFESYFRKKIEDIEAADLALADIPEEAVVYRDKKRVLIEIDRLRDVWSEQVMPMWAPYPPY
ncbi:MAG: hypothetical protein JRK53_08320 [Deltaproteobacteria bacterium]|nr:hypothetical protein [Deltaproteobacteria bacterium]